jgi:hypothetical protein
MTIQDERTASLVAALQKASLPSDVTDPNITYHERIQQKQASSQEENGLKDLKWLLQPKDADGAEAVDCAKMTQNTRSPNN